MMKKLIIGLVLLCSLSAQAQFPTTDSLRKYINKWVRNSAVDAFTNLRLNTILLGMTRFSDSTYGGQVQNFVQSSPGVLRLTLLNGDVFEVDISTGTGSLVSVGGGASLLKSSTEIKSLVGDATILLSNNTNTITIRGDTSVLATRSWVNTVLPDSSTYATRYYVDTGQANLRTELLTKQPIGNYITQLNGDVIANGPGNANAVLSNTTVIPATYTNATITVDAKGRITFADNGTSGGGGSTDNILVGGGHRILVPSSQAIKTLFGGYGVFWDSTAYSQGLSVNIDSTKWITVTNFANKISYSDTSALFAPYRNAINARVKYSDTSSMLNAYQVAINGKQNALGFTPENVANKSNNTSLGGSATLYPTQNAVKTYVDAGLAAKQDLLGYTPENIANKSTNTALGNSNILYPTQNAVKVYVDNGLATKQNTLSLTTTGTGAATLVGDVLNIPTPAGATYTAGYGLTLASNQFRVDTATIFAPYLTAINARVKYSDTSTMLTAYRNALNTKLNNVTNYLTAGTNVNFTGTGTLADPYVINATPGGGGSGTVNSGLANRLAYYSANGTTVDDLAAIIGNRALISDANGLPVASDVTATELSYVDGVTSNIQTQLNGKQGTLTLTTTGTSGAASLIGNTLNIPQYAGTTYTGTANRISVSGSVIDIASNYAGQSSINTLGTVTTGVWNGTAIGLPYIAQGGATTGQVLKWNGTAWAPGTDNEGEGGGETSELVGTANRITVSGTTTTQIDIASTYAGQTSINTLGTIGTGTWQSTKIGMAYGGVPTGGSIGWILAKTSNADNAVGWIPAPTSTMYYPGTGILIDGENNISIDPGYDFGGVTPGNKVDINVVDANTYNINSGVVSNTKLANMAGNTIKGRLSSTGVPQDLTGTQVTSLLDQFSTSTKGLVPAASGGNLTEHFLRKDGTWALPPSADTVSLSNRINQKLNPADTVNLRRSIDRKARVFNVLDYGATGDGVQGRSNVTSGSATITCGSCSFTSADIGKVIKVSRGGASARDHVTTIASINSGTSVQMTSAAANTVTNAEFDYGTDQTAAIQAAANAAHAAGGGDVYIPAGIYILNGALQTSISGANPNCQIYIPYESNTSINRTNIRFIGEVAPQFSPWGLYEDTHPTHKGTVLLSTIRGSGTAPGVFGSAGAAASYYFNYNYSAFKNLTIMVLSDPGNGGPSMGGISMSHGGPINVDNVLVSIDGSALHSAEPVNEVAGIIPNTKNGETMSQISNSMVGGFRYGILTGDHTVLNQAQAFWCWAAIVPTENFQPAYGGRVLIHFSKHGIFVPNSTILGIPAGKSYFKFDEAHIEIFNNLGYWWDYESCIKDDGNLGVADVTFGLSEAFVGYDDDGSLFIKQGGAGIKSRQIGSGGIGGSGNLQAVTDEGNETSNGIILNNSGGLVGGLSILSSSASSFASVGFRNNANHLSQLYLTGTSHSTPATLGLYNNGPGGISLTADIPADNDSSSIKFFAGGGVSAAPLVANINGSGLTLAASKYINFGTTNGTSGYGIRDNAGTMQFKNSGGSWTNFGSGGSGSDLQAVTTVGNTTTNGMVITNTGGLSGGLSILSSSASSYASLGYRNDQNDLGQIFMNGSSNPVSSIITNRSIGIYTDGTGGMGFAAERANATIRFGTGTSADLRLTINDNGLLQPASGYHNYGTTAGSTGYGFRDNAGTMEYKNSGGSWTTFAGGGGGSQDLQSVTNIGNTTDDGLIISNAGGMNNGFKVTATGSTSYASLSMLNNLGNTAQVGLTGSSFSASGGFTQEGLFVYNGAPGGVSLIADNATAGFRVTTGGQTVRFAIGSSGGIQTPGLTSGYLKVDGSGNWSVDAGTGGGMTNPMTTSQDIIVGGSSGTPTRLGAGSDGQVLKMVSGSIQWSTDATGGGGGTDFYTTDGSLTSNRTVSGGGSYSLSLGGASSRLTNLNLYAGRTNISGAVSYNLVSPTGSSNFTVLANNHILSLSTSIAANRTITFPNPTLEPDGREIILVMKSSANSFKWSLASGIADVKTGTTFTQLEWGTVYRFMVVDAAWLLIEEY